jgi:hypothetical protein
MIYNYISFAKKKLSTFMRIRLEYFESMRMLDQIEPAKFSSLSFWMFFRDSVFSIFFFQLILCPILHFFLVNYDKVNSVWENWLNLGLCSVTCGDGTRSRLRSGDNPSPSNGGEHCQGSSVDNQNCKDEDCHRFGKFKTKQKFVITFTNEEI